MLSEKQLFLYEKAEDSQACDCLYLPGWSLSLRDQGMALHHEEYHPITMKVKRQSELEQWEAQLRAATQRMSIEGLNLERGSSSDFDEQGKVGVD